MVHLNELHDKYKDKGLVVLGVTNEPRGAVAAFVEKNGAEYPIVIESSDSIKAFQSNAFPTVVLIGANGRIISTDHPSTQSIEQALEGARMLPEFPKSLKSIKKALDKDQFAKAIGKLEKIIGGASASEEDKTIARDTVAWINWYGDSNFEGAVKDRDAGNVYMAWQSFDYLSDAYKGHEIGTKSAGEAKAIMGDKAMKREVKAGALLAEVRTEMAGATTAKAALKCLKPILAKKYAETQAGKEAKTLADDLATRIK